MRRLFALALHEYGFASTPAPVNRSTRRILAAQAGEVLGVGARGRVAGADPERVVRPEAQAAPAVAPARRRDARDDGRLPGEQAAAGAEDPGDHPHVVGAALLVALAGVDPPVLVERGVDLDAHEARLPRGPQVGEVGLEGPHGPPAWVPHRDPARTLGEEHAAIGGEGEVPRDVETRHDRGHLQAGRRLAGGQPGPGHGDRGRQCDRPKCTHSGHASSLSAQQEHPTQGVTAARARPPAGPAPAHPAPRRARRTRVGGPPSAGRRPSS